MNKFKLLWLLLTSLAVLASPSRAGSWSSAGGDWSFLNANTAWFVGADRTVTLCYEVAPGFGADSASLERAIRTGFESWTRYIDDKGIQTRYQARNAQLATHYRLLGTCDGTQDLTLYFGVQSAAIAQAAKAFVRPVSFAHKGHYDWRHGWSKGFLWFSMPKTYSPEFPDWSVADQLQGMMLHELGHVFGCDHVDGTIMSESIVVVAMATSDPSTAAGAHLMLTSIDQSRELVLSDRLVSYSGFLPVDGTADGRQSYAWLVGRPLVGSVTATLRRTAPRAFVLAITDAQGSVQAAVTLTQEPYEFAGGAKAFRVDYDEGDAAVDAALGQVALGTLTAQDGTRRPIVITRNATSGEAPLSLQLADTPQRQPLFEGRLDPSPTTP
jgi:hypothetical protein